MILDETWVTIYCVPLQCPPHFWFKFRIKMITQFFLIVNICGGNPDKLRSFSNSIGYRVMSSSSTTQSILLDTIGSPGKSLTNSEFNESILTFNGVRIAQL